MNNCHYFDIDKVCHQLHNHFPTHTPQPIIGITGNFTGSDITLAEGYCASVLRAGGTPLIIPPYDDLDPLLNTLDRVDGLLLTGGGDINPLFVGEEPIKALQDINHRRDRQELLLARLAANRQLPILGICRGIQVMAAAYGGTLYQDIYTQTGGQLIKHSQQLDRCYPSHTIDIVPDSLLSRIMLSTHYAVNSFHHQAVKQPPKGFRVSATSSDGIIEAIESTQHKALLGVQWHPECMILAGDDSMLPLFKWLVHEATTYRQATLLHQKIITLDSHCDTPMFFDQGVAFHTRESKVLVDLHKMYEGKLDASIMVAYLPQQDRTPEALAQATAKADCLLSEIKAMVEAQHNYVAIAYTPDDIAQHKWQGKRSIMLGIENGYAIGLSVDNVTHFRRQGVVYMTLCHNGGNDICDSARGASEHNGVSSFGKEVIAAMNRVGMMVDLSHASEKSFYDALQLSTTPIVCSHSSCRALCNHPRNLTDNQMCALAERGGVMQLCLYGGFLRKEGEATICDAMKHLEHMIAIMGIDHVGIGTDFDGDGGITGCASASEVLQLTRHMLVAGYSELDIQKIWGGNFMRVMHQVQAAGNM